MRAPVSSSRLSIDALPPPLGAGLADTEEILLPEARSGRLTTALPRKALACYALFCDAERVPEWLSVVRSAVVVNRDEIDRPIEVAYLARLEGATVGYTCHYHYEPERRRVTFATAAESRIRVAGSAQFEPLGELACLMSYSLELGLGDLGALPAWADPMFEGHAASAILSDFRDWVLRVL